jgi:hypothetical protein
LRSSALVAQRLRDPRPKQPLRRVSANGTGPAQTQDMEFNRRLEIARTATIVVVVLAAAASLAGALLPGLYAEDAMAAAMRGQDLATLSALLFLTAALHRMRRGSPRAERSTGAAGSTTQLSN